MTDCVQWNPVFPPQGIDFGTARLAGQRLTHWPPALLVKFSAVANSRLFSHRSVASPPRETLGYVHLVSFGP